MALGITQFRSPCELWLGRVLLQPFRSEHGGYAIGRREEAAR